MGRTDNGHEAFTPARVPAARIWYDEYTGLPLDPALVQQAINEEMDAYRQHRVYHHVPVSDAWTATGEAPIKVRWVVCNKGDSERPDYRARLVAKEIKLDTRLDLFAATSPLPLRTPLATAAPDARRPGDVAGGPLVGASPSLAAWAPARTGPGP